MKTADTTRVNLRSMGYREAQEWKGAEIEAVRAALPSMIGAKSAEVERNACEELTGSALFHWEGGASVAVCFAWDATSPRWVATCQWPTAVIPGEGPQVFSPGWRRYGSDEPDMSVYSITVDFYRGHEALAKEIKRRLLDGAGYLAEWERMDGKRRETEERAHSHLALARKCAADWGSSRVVENPTQQLCGGHGRWSASVHANGTASLQLEKVPVEKVAEILRLAGIKS